MEKIEEFVRIAPVFRSDGDGNGDGNGNGYGYGNGDGNGNGYGYGYGYGDGDGNGNGNGYGYGYGDGLKSLNNEKVYLIDGVETIIKSVKNNVAKGFIVNSDLSLTECYIAKGENYFAHGETLKEAVKSLQEKLLLKLPICDRIEKFKEHFSNLKKKYPAKDFFDWHYFLTGSCNMGRLSFVSNHNIDLEKDTISVFEFIELTLNSYGSEIIKELKLSYEKG